MLSIGWRPLRIFVKLVFKASSFCRFSLGIAGDGLCGLEENPRGLRSRIFIRQWRRFSSTKRTYGCFSGLWGWMLAWDYHLLLSLKATSYTAA